jgi:hypothetical protein
LIIARRTSDQYRPVVVGVEWVDRCREENCHIEEEDYLVDLANIPNENFKVGISSGSRTSLIPVLQRKWWKKAKSLTTDSYDGSFEEPADSSFGSPSIGGECY